VKICIIGCGAEGGGIAGLLARQEEVEGLILVDIDEGLAEAAAKRVKSLDTKVRVKVEKVDATKREDIVRVAKGMDIIFNATVPVTNIPIMQACLDVGAHYLDLFSYPFKMPGVPPLETIDAQLELDGEFKAAGLSAVINVGVCPGWSDVAARYLMEQFDTVDTVMVRWVDWYDSSQLMTSFNPLVTMGISLPQPICWDNGEVKAVDLYDSKEDYEWPEPLGRHSLYTGCLDPEARTISEFAGKAANKSIRHVEVKSGLRVGRWKTSPELWVEALRRQAVKHPLEEVTANLLELLGESFVEPLDIREVCDKGIVADGAFGASVEVSGTQDGRHVRHTMYNVMTLKEAMEHIPWANHMVYSTIGAVPIEVVLMLDRGEITKRGVIGAGSLDNYKKILEGVRNRGHRLSEKIERF
jgi:saccharopine dehydrogenase-like NADP-dependent oxidoreductase